MSTSEGAAINNENLRSSYEIDLQNAARVLLSLVHRYLECLSAIQMVISTYEVNRLWSDCGVAVGFTGPGISTGCSHFVYDPEKRHEVWRHITHAFAHDG